MLAQAISEETRNFLQPVANLAAEKVKIDSAIRGGDLQQRDHLLSFAEPREEPFEPPHRIAPGSTCA